MGEESDGWRIDDLARAADLTVDTIRYYRREGLLPAPERCGRTNRYGPEHLERLERIKELQARRFSLAAIRALLTEDRRELVDGIFGGGDDREYTLAELVERSGIAPSLAEELRVSGMLREPADFGRDAYDGDDLELLRTLAELHALGLPASAIVEVGRIYAQGIESTQRQVVDLFATGGELDWDPTDLHAFQEVAASHASDILMRARHIVNYTHHRTIQRLTLGAIERGTVTPPDDGA
ncbi:MAG TPA: helix-turn-helix domain-containing protein [Acidimicrobiia bacterium]|nr:helix-turn-helix domain-containing protein [Acidimicrobiia bacterium]